VKKILCLLLMFLLPAYAAAEHLPVMVSIGQAEGTVKVNGRNVKSAGVGKHAPWGIHEADVVYENLHFQTGCTRLNCLFFSSYPAAVGPVRSVRLSHFQQREEWGAVLFFAGDLGAGSWQWPEMQALSQTSLIFNHHRYAWARACTARIKGKKAPDNLSVDLTAVLKIAKAEKSGGFLPLRFANEPSVLGGKPQKEFMLDWGDPEYLIRFVYDEGTGQYLRYCSGAPSLSYLSPTLENAVQLGFKNVIIQHVNYRWKSRMMPLMDCTGSGKAEYWINGMHMEGSWQRNDVQSRTVYLDTEGNEMLFAEGKTYIAQFPAEESK